ncbi:MAG: phytanoyl-CoA dioxygenase family protein [Deferribacteres bacterium]|nr:phytanoyl-CoA dioxygenase family protein [candidate division KSB1 bacterium]MCB9510753.1 phytanoyl-CoA dioxygenase family protein [Deferribacteres bacterium]
MSVTPSAFSKNPTKPNSQTVVEEKYISQIRADGYTIVRGLFSTHEVEQFLEHFMALRASGALPDDWSGIEAGENDPLKKFPRMIHMHRWDQLSLDWLLDPRIAAHLEAFLKEKPLAVQTMLYFKPPGARGQALHQDQYFLRVQPGNCMAAWLALDACDEENGCMQIVPRTHDLPLLCAEQANTEESFTGITVALPENAETIPMVMQPGDVLFFNGMVIHGSFPNISSNRFRRSLIGHYISADATKVADYYHPVLSMDGIEVQLADSPEGGPCGVWVDHAGRPVIEPGTHRV